MRLTVIFAVVFLAGLVAGMALEYYSVLRDTGRRRFKERDLIRPITDHRRHRVYDQEEN